MTQNNNNNVTLKTLTAYQLLSSRENMCELFGLLDDSERRSLIVGKNRDQNLEEMKKRLETLRTEVETQKGI
ncbi:LAFE_0F11364g1_1 [Lachancea fermentati]|uniref:LAFE_0F11364g1_1 n=1 Tax=Lachancea fermentati TaxID=4955 RepID=A0A1G4MFT4_LACFM|nr:LAFE_0F11364g1_1 [Lachancea fermentati]